MRPKTVLLTGAGGFVGSHALRHILVNTEWNVIAPVTFQHKGHSDRISRLFKDHPQFQSRVDIQIWDMRTPANRQFIERCAKVDYVWNIASNSHVDHSISAPATFITDNVAIALNALELARLIKPRLFLQMSTDEVYGPALSHMRHEEWSPILPSNPYSASKAAQEAIAISYWRTYAVPLVITNTMNIIGEMQDPEKFVPKTLKALLDGEPVKVHVSPEGIPGSRFYLHAQNLAAAWLFLTKYLTYADSIYNPGIDRQIPIRYNIVGDEEIDNLEMAEVLANLAERPLKVELVDFHSSRPGHDLRYALDGKRLAGLGWTPPLSLSRSLERTVRWTLDNPQWLTA